VGFLEKQPPASNAESSDLLTLHFCLTRAMPIKDVIIDRSWSFHSMTLTSSQIKPPRLCATKKIGRSILSVASRFVAKLVTRFCACRRTVFCPADLKKCATSASYPNAMIRALGISEWRRVSGHDFSQPSAVHVSSRLPVRP
jgi:hypothetical protein